MDWNLELVGRLLKMSCGRELPGKAASWISLRIFFVTYDSFSLFICIHVLATSLCLVANEDRPVRSGQENISAGVESENQIRIKKAVVRRRLAPLSNSRDCQERSALFQC